MEDFFGPAPPAYIKVLNNPIKYREMTEKYMKPGQDIYNRLYYPMAERPAWTYLRYNPIHVLLLFLSFASMTTKWRTWTLRSKYYMHMYGFKRSGTANVDLRVRHNKRRRPVRRMRNTLAKLLMAYTNRALLFAFIMPWKWAIALAFGMGYFGRNTRRRRERRIKQRLQFAPRAMIFGEQWTIGSWMRLWRIPRRFFQKVYWSRRWKLVIGLIKRKRRWIKGGLLCGFVLRAFTAPRNPAGHGAKTRRGVPGNVRRFLREYTHPFQITDFHTPHAFQRIYPNIMQAYQHRRMQYGQDAFVTMSEWKGHNVMNNYGQFF